MNSLFFAVSLIAFDPSAVPPRIAGLVAASIADTSPAPAQRRASSAGRGRRAVAVDPPQSRIDQANAAAAHEPLARDFQKAIQVYPFEDGALYRLYASPGRITDIALEPGETVTAVAAGDTMRWTVGDTSSGNGGEKRAHILIKPHLTGLKTNLVITTDRRAYHLQLESTASTAMTGIAWSYGADQVLALTGGPARAGGPLSATVAIDRLDFGYRLSGDRPRWRPVGVFDDGRQTFILFPSDIASAEAPPLFVVGHEGRLELVNYRMTGRYYVVDRLFDVAELRLGERRPSIVRIEREQRRPVRVKG